MHPSGVQYGLSLGLLQLQGRHAVLSDRVFDSVSRFARDKIRGRNRLTGTDTWWFCVCEGLARVKNQHSGRSRRTVPFFMGLEGVAETSMIPVAEKTRVGTGLARWVLPSDQFTHEFDDRARRLELTENMAKNHRLLFRMCCDLVRAFCTRFDPPSVRHTELLAVCIFEVMHRSRSLELTVSFQRINKKFELRHSCPIPGRRHFFRTSHTGMPATPSF